MNEKSKPRRRWLRLAVAGVAAVVVLLAFAAYWVLGLATVTQVSDHVALVQFRSPAGQIGANSVLIKGQDALAVIDAQLPAQGKRLRAIADKAGKPLQDVVISHWHYDHSGGTAAFSDQAQVIAHRRVGEVLSDPHEGKALTTPDFYRAYPARPPAGLPSRLYDTSFDIELGGLPVRLIHFPNAHTDGDTVTIVGDAEAVVTGDLVWSGSYPFIDVYSGGSIYGLKAALDTLVEQIRPETKVIPGHGGAMTRDELIAYRDLVGLGVEYIEAAKRIGKTLDELRELGLPPELNQWPGGLVSDAEFLRMLYQSQVLN